MSIEHANNKFQHVWVGLKLGEGPVNLDLAADLSK